MKSKSLFILPLILMMYGAPVFGFCQKAEVDTSISSSAHFQDDWFGEDKVHHTVMSFMLTWLGTLTHDLMHDHGWNQDIRAGAGFSITLGLAKEFRDRRMPKNRFSWKDIVADLLGIAMAVLLLKRGQYGD